MSITNGDIFSAREPLLVLMAEKFPVATSYKLAQLGRKMNDQLAVIGEVRDGLIKKYGETNGQGHMVVTPDNKHFAEFAQEWNELMMMEVKLDVGEKIKMPDTLEVAPSVLMALDKWIEI